MGFTFTEIYLDHRTLAMSKMNWWKDTFQRQNHVFLSDIFWTLKIDVIYIFSYDNKFRFGEAHFHIKSWWIVNLNKGLSLVSRRGNSKFESKSLADVIYFFIEWDLIGYNLILSLNILAS